MLKKFASLLVVVLVVGLSACSDVPAGNVAVKVDLYADKGVQNTVVGPGRYVSGMNTKFYLFPTFTQTDKWMASDDEGKGIDESLTFQVAGGVAVNTDIGIAFRIDEKNVPTVFQKYRRGVDEISDSFLRNIVRDALNRSGPKYDVETLQGAGKQKLLDEVQGAVIAKAAESGITVEQVSQIGEMRFPPVIVRSINAKIEATQAAMKVENQLRETRAQAEKQIVASEAEVKVAENESKAMKLRGDAMRQNQNLLKLKELEVQAEAVEKWDGKLPVTQLSGAMPFLNVK